MGLILNDLKNACELEHVCDYVNNRTTSSMNYISTENMLPNKGGISESTIIPPGTTTEYKIGDILISNIRPYFQKIWCADRCGGCSADVLCIRAKENTDSKYLYYLLSQQAFFDYVMSGAKGCKMPRGDKKQIMQWPVNIPAIDVQKKVVAILSSLDNKIRLNRRINEKFSGFLMCIIACISGRNSPCLKNFSGPYFLGFGDICSNFEIHKYLTLNRINL